jgi:hypothetical protein
MNLESVSISLISRRLQGQPLGVNCNSNNTQDTGGDTDRLCKTDRRKTAQLVVEFYNDCSNRRECS